MAQGLSEKVSDLGRPGWPWPVDKREGFGKPGWPGGLLTKVKRDLGAGLAQGLRIKVRIWRPGWPGVSQWK